MRLSGRTIFLMCGLALWFALNFVGWAMLVEAETLFSLAGLMMGVLAALILAGLMRARFAALFVILAHAIWAALQIETHWSTYLMPATQSKLAWYERVWGENWHLLPPAPGYTVPDAYHTILFVLIVSVLVLALSDVVARES
jgi:hypothetical protein